MGVVKLADYRPLEPVVERNVADLDDGYARLSNMLLEAYSGADLTKRHFKVLLAILRKTYGWNKPMDRITDSQLSEITKLPVKRCNEAKLELVRMNIIKQQGGMFGPNKNISEWRIPQNEGMSLKTGDKTSLNLRECYPSKQGDTKDTIQKKEIQDKNTMSESVRTECEKSSDRHEDTDKAFEEIFWCAGMRKAGKKNAASAFRTQFREWRKTTRGTASEFATMLAEDIACRNGKQFGFDRLLPSSYLNGQRWNDEKPETIQPQSKPSSAITVSKTGYVFFDR
ncbi:replication protein [Salmonella enterica subsp. enterica serovar Ohio]|uniref:Replication protein n=1 Tax=Salmonella enterica subsp. enterica serovar Ohio TaxID=117541 RepID=A0A5I1HQL1_SALET|nr:replication protein [Salmonella enterica]EAU7427054.1 replication protein [Salmonella enterica subsp. enterica serovar Ohio]EAW1188987.1 replication protein [Salmonella enterica subsp. enterica]EBV4312706.1 replication protein [Salmonella enterica subsp. enterica serovar Livingstone]EBV9549380.1 replication protein [Salmonella enterica subsp. enterica serovar Montevideo]ECF1520771.1 replication protein [Salmonella enterica subsp. enterica serovar Tennessee]EDR0645601.1 replication protein 